MDDGVSTRRLRFVPFLDIFIVVTLSLHHFFNTMASLLTFKNIALGTAVANVALGTIAVVRSRGEGQGGGGKYEKQWRLCLVFFWCCFVVFLFCFFVAKYCRTDRAAKAEMNA